MKPCGSTLGVRRVGGAQRAKSGAERAATPNPSTEPNFIVKEGQARGWGMPRALPARGNPV